LLGLVLCGLVGFLVVLLTTDPPVGDLTRLGGYTENRFGWRNGQTLFAPALAHAAAPTGPAIATMNDDIIVLGDSFSSHNSAGRQARPGQFWTDFLASETSLSVGVLDLDAMSAASFAASDIYRLRPPRLVILEVVARELRRRIGGPGITCPAPPAPRLPGFPILHRQTARDTLARPTAGLASVTPESIDVTLDMIRKTLLRQLTGFDSTPVLRLKLDRSDLFSSREPATLLAYADDTRKARWSSDDWSSIRCGVTALRRDIEANGVTRFALLIAPDKSWAYAPYLEPGVWAIDPMERLDLDGAVIAPRVDQALRAAIAAGTRDVYLPDDTHWGTTGARIAAQVVARALQPPTTGLVSVALP
jgi:hypothetical protein